MKKFEELSNRKIPIKIVNEKKRCIAVSIFFKEAKNILKLKTEICLDVMGLYFNCLCLKFSGKTCRILCERRVAIQNYIKMQSRLLRLTRKTNKKESPFEDLFYLRSFMIGVLQQVLSFKHSQLMLSTEYYFRFASAEYFFLFSL
jgi:hypothetical protein